MKYNPKIVCAYFGQQGIPIPQEEYRFHLERRWRFDFAWPDYKVALEVEGGIYTGGRHQRISGFKADMEKYNKAAELGWRVLRVLPADICMSDTVDTIRTTLLLPHGK